MEIISRQEYLQQIRSYFGKQTIVVLTGQRRVGKSFVLKDLHNHLLKRQATNVIFIDKEKSTWDGIQNYRDLNAYISEHRDPQKTNYVLIDEVQEIDEFEKAVRNWRTEDNIEIVLTGSNAETLSGDLATILAARFHEIHIQSLTYRDFLRFHSLEDTDQSLLQFIECGGLPGLMAYDLKDTEMVRTYSEDVLNTALLKDIILKRNIRNSTFLHNLVRFLADNTGKMVSATSISNYMRGKDSPVSKDLVLAYLDYLCEAYIVRKVGRFEIKGKKLLESNGKYYFEDHGIRNTQVGYGRDKDIEKLLENIVYQQLVHDGYQVYVGQLNAGEIDFVCLKNGQRAYVQAAYVVANEDTREREFGSLKYINDNYPKYVISMTPLVKRNEIGRAHV